MVCAVWTVILLAAQEIAVVEIGSEMRCLADKGEPEQAPSACELSGTIVQDTTLSADDCLEYRLIDNLTVQAGITLRVEAGVQVRCVSGKRIVVHGRLEAIGTADERILFDREGGSGTWGGIEVRQGTPGCTLRFVDILRASPGLRPYETGNAPIVVEDSSFEGWSGNAVDAQGAHGLVLRRSAFGLQGQSSGETIHTSGMGILVEYCTFGRPSGDNDVVDLSGARATMGPGGAVFRYNTFLGGTDDALDYDDSEGWAIGNLIMDFWPTDLNARANGGGITGTRGDVVAMHNVIYRCYHGIGFKDGADCLIANNTIVDCHVGITLYKAESCNVSNSHGTLYNNIVWGVGKAEDGVTPLAIVLDGSWWARYCDENPPHATVEVYDSIIEGGYAGPNVHRVTDSPPLLADPQGGDFTPICDLASQPAVISPAIDAGFGGPFSGPAWIGATGAGATLVDRQKLDRTGASRLDLPCVADTGSGDYTYGDIGAVELTDAAVCGSVPARFVRGDVNWDGEVDLSDAIAALLHLFLGVAVDCEDAVDVNDDGSIDLSDPIGILNYLFAGRIHPSPPWGEPAPDPTDEDGLGCDRRAS